MEVDLTAPEPAAPAAAANDRANGATTKTSAAIEPAPASEAVVTPAAAPDGAEPASEASAADAAAPGTGGGGGGGEDAPRSAAKQSAKQPRSSSTADPAAAPVKKKVKKKPKKKQQWAVEKVVDKRTSVVEGRKRPLVEYRVRWVGYTEDDDTWEVKGAHK